MSMIQSKVRNVEATNPMVIELIGWNIGHHIYVFFCCCLNILLPSKYRGGPVNFPFPGTIPSSPKTSCWKHKNRMVLMSPRSVLSAEAANLPRWKVVDGQYVPLKWGAPRSYSPRWSHRSHNFFQIESKG